MPKAPLGWLRSLFSCLAERYKARHAEAEPKHLACLAGVVIRRQHARCFAALCMTAFVTNNISNDLNHPSFGFAKPSPPHLRRGAGRSHYFNFNLKNIMAQQLRGNDLRQLGFPEGRAIGLALAQLQRKHLKRLSLTNQLTLLEQILTSPMDFVTHLDWSHVAAALLPPPSRHIELVARKPYALYGAEHIEAGALHQMDTAMKLPVTVAGALMPDAHHGYGLPIGGVLATDNAVIPYAVGVDIGCRMALSVFNLPPKHLTQRVQELQKLLMDNTRFGNRTGFQHGKKMGHEVLDRDEFRDIPFLRNKQATAAEQIGTSGSGNHFVEFGIVDITDPTNEMGVPVGQYLGLLVALRLAGPGRGHSQPLHQAGHGQLPAARRSQAPGLACPGRAKLARNTGRP